MAITNRLSGTKYKVMIVDDHPIVRRGLRELIVEEPDLEVCAEAGSEPEALQQVETTLPDVVVVDLSLSSGHGLDLIRKIKSKHKRIKILVSTMHDAVLYAERTLRAGATGYINKQESPGEIIDALRQVLRGDFYLSPDVASRFLYRLQRNQQVESDPIDSLTDREVEVFEMVGRGMSTKQIAKKLGLSPKTIESHREKIKTKLNLRSGSEVNRCATQWLQERS